MAVPTPFVTELPPTKTGQHLDAEQTEQNISKCTQKQHLHVWKSKEQYKEHIKHNEKHLVPMFTVLYMWPSFIFLSKTPKSWYLIRAANINYVKTSNIWLNICRHATAQTIGLDCWTGWTGLKTFKMAESILLLCLYPVIVIPSCILFYSQ